MPTQRLTAETTPPAPPNAMIIFGAAGDLTKRKLIPALFHLCHGNLLPDTFAVVGLDRLEMDDATFQSMMAEEVKRNVGSAWDAETWARLCERLHYMPGNITEQQTYVAALRAPVRNRRRARNGRKLSFLSRCSTFALRRHHPPARCRRSDRGDARTTGVASSSRSPSASIWTAPRRSTGCSTRPWTEDQIYRIDHYLGKETVQNIMVFRFSNGFIEPLWNRQHIDHIQITVAESVGVEHRGPYYDYGRRLARHDPEPPPGAARVSRHGAAQLVRLQAVRDEINKVLDAVHPLTPEQVLTNAVRGQYGEGVMPTARRYPPTAPPRGSIRNPAPRPSSHSS